MATTQNSSTSLSAQARAALQAGDVQTAIAAYSEAIEARDLKPENLANALINRGFAYQQAQEHNRAVDDYTAALRIDAMSAKLRATALYNRGLSQQKLNHAVLAIEDFTSALFLDPEFAHAYYLRGTLLRENGQLLFALSDYEKALRFKHPQPHLAYYGEALAYEQLHRMPEAKDALNKAVAANPTFEPARTKLASLGEVAAVANAEPQLITASITSPEQIVRKEELPDAVKPPLQLVGDLPVQMVKAVPVKPAKLFDDRIPAEDAEQTASIETVADEQPAPAAQPAADYTLQADAIPQPTEAKPAKSVGKPQAEQIVAVEALPEPAADTEPTADTKPVEVPEAKVEPAGDDQVEPATTRSSDVQLTGWSVQLSSARDEKLAWGTWDKLKARHKALSDMKPVVVRADLGKKGVYYRLRLGGFDSQDDAKSACGRLKSRGLSCFVSRIDS